MFVYLDNASTTKPYAEVVERVENILLNNFGNPSSLHKLGVETEKLIKESRKQIATIIGANPSEIIFTSGGTEADNMIFNGIAEVRKKTGNTIITSKVEHPAVMECCKALESKGFRVIYLDVDDKCRVNLSQLKENLSNDVFMISIMSANNEVGTLMPLKEIAKIKEEFCQNYDGNILFHTDAIQGFGKMNMSKLPVDSISLSAHKIHGTKGVGALYLKEKTNFKQLIFGGGQENNLRSGTENVQGIASFGLAAKICYDNLDSRIESIKKTRNYLWAGIKDQISDIRVNGFDEEFINLEDSKFLPSILNVSFLGTRSEVLLHTLEQDDIFVSTGSACSSNKNSKSHVLEAMGLNSHEIDGAIRFGISEFNTIEEIDYVLDKLKKAVTQIRKIQGMALGGRN